MLHQFTLEVSFSDVESVIGQLNAADIYYIYYESPIEVTAYEYGYQYHEKKDERIKLHICAEADAALDLPEAYFQLLQRVLDVSRDQISYELLDEEDWQQPFDDVHLDGGWVICSPHSEGTKEAKRLFFDPQGAFGTGLHGTTQDCLNMILEQDFSGQAVADLGTGSGILSMAAGLKGASSIVAVDMEPVEREILYNASLNGLQQIQVVQADLLTGEYTLSEAFDWMFINIGGEETAAIVEQHRLLDRYNGKYLLSGLAEWSLDTVLSPFLKANYEMLEKRQTNEWVSVILEKKST